MLAEKCIRKTTSTFRGKKETNRGYFTTLQQDIYFRNFLEKRGTRWFYFKNAIIFSFPNSTSWQNIEKLTWILLYSEAVWIKKMEWFPSIFINHVRNISYFYWCVRRQHRICSIVSKFRQFENQHNQSTGPCVTKTITVGFYLSWLFYLKNLMGKRVNDIQFCGSQQVTSSFWKCKTCPTLHQRWRVFNVSGNVESNSSIDIDTESSVFF